MLPTNCIDEIIALASRGNELPSPRGVADAANNFDVDANDGSDDAAGNPKSALRHFSSPERAQGAISECATRFVDDVWIKSVTMTGYFYRMTVRTSDVAKALDKFVNYDATDAFYRSFPTGTADEGRTGGEERAREEEMDEAWNAEVESGVDEGDDDGFVYDTDDESRFADDFINIETDNTSASPAFDAAYPPLSGDIPQLSDAEFREHIFLPVLEKRRHSGVPLAEGVDEMLKLAMYAFLVSKLQV